MLSDNNLMDVIVIDDDKFMGNVFENLFKQEGISYKLYDNPHEGLEVISKEQPRCAIVDYNMPLLNGDDLIVISSQKLQFQHTDFIMITGEEFSDIERMKLMTLGFQYIFKKSELRKGDFLSVIKDIISESNAA